MKVEHRIIDCACGCGQTLDQYDPHHPYKPRHFINRHSGYRGGRYIKQSGYVVVRQRGPENRESYEREHILIAEKALGRKLERKHPVHHHDENRANNANNNLVICADHDYHQLLHVRARILRAGGDPNIHKLCGKCGIRPREAFGLNRATRDQLTNICKACSKKQCAALRAVLKRLDEAEA
jgi:hypothetical protein